MYRMTTPWPLLIFFVCACDPAAEANAAGGTEGVEEAAKAAMKAPAVEHGHLRRVLAHAAGDTPTGQRIEEAQRALRASPEDPDQLAKTGFLFIRRYRETSDGGLLALARDCARAGAGQAREHPAVLALQTVLHQYAHRFSAATETARRLMRARPDDPTAAILLGDAELELGRYDRAVEAYQKAIDIRPDLRSYNRAAYMRWLHGDVEGAKDLLALAMGAGSRSDPAALAWCLVDLGLVLWHEGELAAAGRAADRALETMPGYAPALRLLARVRAARGDRSGAAEVLEGLVDRDVATVEDSLWLAEWIAEERPEKAGALVDEAVRRRREDPRALALYFARHDRNRDEALDLVERELRSRADISTHAVHALALARAGEHSEAAAALARARKLGTPDARFDLYEAVLQLEAGSPGAAREALARAQASHPNIDPVLSEELQRRLSET